MKCTKSVHARWLAAIATNRRVQPSTSNFKLTKSCTKSGSNNLQMFRKTKSCLYCKNGLKAHFIKYCQFNKKTTIGLKMIIDFEFKENELKIFIKLLNNYEGTA